MKKTVLVALAVTLSMVSCARTNDEVLSTQNENIKTDNIYSRKPATATDKDVVGENSSETAEVSAESFTGPLVVKPPR